MKNSISKLLIGLVLLFTLGGFSKSPNEDDFNLMKFKSSMKSYHKNNMRYANKFKDLNISILCPSKSDYDLISSSKINSEIWKPNGCIYTYKIIYSNRNQFRIDAINSYGETVNFVTDKMSDLEFLKNSFRMKELRAKKEREKAHS